MKDRLMELLTDTLKEWECDVTKETISEIADHLLANGVIVPQCKVGDTVWCLNEFPQNYAFECKVSSIEWDKSNAVIVVDRIVGKFVLQRVRGYYFSDFGKTVFLTKAEAEKAIAERREK